MTNLMGLANAATGILGMGLDMATAKWQDRRQQEQNQALLNQQVDAQGQLMGLQQQYGFDMMNAMNKHNSPKAQMARLREAGLNPGLMYGGSGAGGTTTGGQSAKGGNIQGATATPTQQMGMGLMMAQMANIKADTKLKGEQASSAVQSSAESVTRQEMMGWQMKDLDADIQNKASQRDLMRVQTNAQEIDNAIREDGRIFELSTLEWLARKAEGEARNALSEANVNERIEDKKVDIVNAEYAGLILQNESSRLGNILTDRQIKEVEEKILTIIDDRKLNERRVSAQELSTAVQDFQAQMKADNPAVWDLVGGIASDGWHLIWEKFGVDVSRFKPNRRNRENNTR